MFSANKKICIHRSSMIDVGKYSSLSMFPWNARSRFLPLKLNVIQVMYRL